MESPRTDEGPLDAASLPLYTRVIVEEAQRRGIQVDLIDREGGLFAYSHGDARVLVRNALPDRTTAIAFSICDDKGLTRRVLERAGLRVPAQQLSDGGDGDREFLERHGHVVVKPVHGEQGRGVSVDITRQEDLRQAVKHAHEESAGVLLEEFVQGEDLRVLVIDYEVVAAAVRRPPHIEGNGRDTVEELIRARSRERERETDGESHIPLDDETRRCVRDAGWQLDDVLPEGRELQVRKTDNVHTGGSIHDVTGEVHPTIRRVAVEAARAIGIPLVGVDFLMPDPQGEDYVIIEANENPGLANHEPQPTVQRFLDYLFPGTRGQ